MVNLVKAKPIEKSKEDLGVRQPFKLPEPEGELSNYVCGLLSTSPIEYYSLGGVDFCKKLLPSEHSLAGKEHLKMEQNILSRPLAQNQVNAIINESKKRLVTIPSKYNESTKDYSPSKKVDLFSQLILCKERDYNPARIVEITAESYFNKDKTKTTKSGS